MGTMNTHSTRPLNNTAHATANLISCMSGATHPSLIHTYSSSSLPYSRPCCEHIPTAVVCLTFDPLPRPKKRVEGSKVTRHGGHAHLHARTIDFSVYITGRICHAQSKTIKPVLLPSRHADMLKVVRQRGEK